MECSAIAQAGGTLRWILAFKDCRSIFRQTRQESILFDETLQWASRGMEAAGVLAIVIGVIFATLRALGLFGNDATAISPYHQFRQTLGRAILLGLELFVAADIIGTVAVEPTLQNVLILALIVLIRTFLSISLTVEIEGRWPGIVTSPSNRLAAGNEPCSARSI